MSPRYARRQTQRPQIDTKFKCQRCFNEWLVGFPTPISQTTFDNRRLAEICTKCSSRPPQHTVVGPLPVIVSNEEIKERA